jgi:CRISPR-associated endonuclease Csn1
MNAIRRLFRRHRLLPRDDRDALRQPGLDPWKLRVQALAGPLTPVEFAVALGHIARRRGFKSNAKTREAETAETTELKRALAASRDRLTQYRTPARMLAEDDRFAAEGASPRRFRNRAGDFARLQHRDDLVAETTALFAAQRSFRVDFATDDLAREFADAAFFQRPLGDGIDLVGPCPFEPGERRAAKHAPSIELLRCLSRLVALTLRMGEQLRPLTPEELTRATTGFGESPTFTYATLRRRLKLPAEARFLGVDREVEERTDVVARGGAAVGTNALRRVVVHALAETAWARLRASSALLDAIAEALSFRSGADSLGHALLGYGLDAGLVEALIQAKESGACACFAGAAHISAKAARKVVEALGQGLRYDKACRAAGYDPSVNTARRAFEVGVEGKEALRRILAQRCISEEVVASPTVRKALTETIKQVKAIVERFGLPDRIHIEVAREMGKSARERREIELGAARRAAARERLRAEFVDLLARAPAGGDAGAAEMLRFELWREQGGLCVYSGAPIDVVEIFRRDNRVHVDHILPWSRFGDDSYANKALCLAAENAAKRDRTPCEWFAQEKAASVRAAFVARVDALPTSARKKRNFKLERGEVLAAKFRERNLNDTRWACRVLAEALQTLYPPSDVAAGGVRRIYARPGALTAHLRHAFGLQHAKTAEGGARLSDDRHHALDAIVVAAITESMLHRATRLVQRVEHVDGDELDGLVPPCPQFREAALDAVDRVFVARAERKRARGKAHDATLRQIAQRDGSAIVFERKHVADLTLADLTRVKDPARNRALVESLRAWIDAGKPSEAPPRSPKGDSIRKVRLASTSRVNVTIDTGNHARPATADRGEMLRVDVFRKANARGEWRYYFTPIYRHEIVSRDEPPMRAVKGGAGEEGWVKLDATYEFLWSLYPMSLVEMVRPDGETICGYFRGLDRHTGALAVSAVADSGKVRKGLGARKLLGFSKLQVDRLGETREVKQEPRLWGGKRWPPG